MAQISLDESVGCGDSEQRFALAAHSARGGMAGAFMFIGCIGYGRGNSAAVVPWPLPIFSKAGFRSEPDGRKHYPGILFPFRHHAARCGDADVRK